MPAFLTGFTATRIGDRSTLFPFIVKNITPLIYGDNFRDIGKQRSQTTTFSSVKKLENHHILC